MKNSNQELGHLLNNLYVLIDDWEIKSLAWTTYLPSTLAKELRKVIKESINE